MQSYVFIVGEVTESSDLLDNCEENVAATMMNAKISIKNLSRGFDEATKKGFVLDWRSLGYCDECEAQDGLCGVQYCSTGGLVLLQVWFHQQGSLFRS